MTVAFEVGICHLLTEFFTDTLIVFTALKTAGTVTAGALQTIANSLYHFFIIVQSNCHKNHSFSIFEKDCTDSAVLFRFRYRAALIRTIIASYSASVR